MTLVAPYPHETIADVARAARSLNRSADRGKTHGSPLDPKCVRVIRKAPNGSHTDFGRVFGTPPNLIEFDKPDLVLDRIVEACRSEGTHVALVLVFKELEHFA